MKLTWRLLAAAVCAAFLTLLATWPGHADEGGGPRPGCIGDSFRGTLDSTKAICSDKYLVRMQPNGDLVLREISSGRACWASGTRAGGDASATFHQTMVGPFVTIDSVSQGKLATLSGSIPRATRFDEVSANVNDRGEFWIGYTRVAGC